MTYLGGTIAALNAAVALWQGRANSAWGASRLWSNGTSFETALATEVALYNAQVALVATRDATIAADAVALAAEVALYNASQAALAAKTTTGINTSSFSGTWPNSTTTYSGTLATLTAPRTGNGLATAIVRVNVSVGTHGQARLLVNGGVVATGVQVGFSGSGGTADFPVSVQQNFTAGDVVTVQVASDGATTLNSGEFYLTVGAT